MTHPPFPPLVLGITGCRQVGKDTLVRHLMALEPRLVRYSFADRLKEDVAPLVRSHMGFDPDNLTPEQKEMVRPLWIGWGMAQRAREPLHWVKIVAGNIDHRWMWMKDGDEQFIPVLTDFRFLNEVSYFKEHYGSSFLLINLTRDGAPPPTEEEEKHYRQVAAMADYNLRWGGESEDQQRVRAGVTLAWIDSEMFLRGSKSHALV